MKKIIKILIDNHVDIQELYDLINTDTTEILDHLFHYDNGLRTLLKIMEDGRVKEGTQKNKTDYILYLVETHYAKVHTATKIYVK